MVAKRNKTKMYSEPQGELVTTFSQKSAELHIFLASHGHFLHKNNTIEGQMRAFSYHSLPRPASFKRGLAVTRLLKINFSVCDSNIAFKNQLDHPFALT